MLPIIYSIQEFLSLTWWLWAAFLLFPLFESTWLFWRQELFKKEIKFILLELKIPREVKTNPRAMEQVLASIHGLRNVPSDLREKWWDGEITRWYSLEMISFGGEVHFYIRTYYKHRNLIEAAIFSYYRDVEIMEVEDYIDRLPSDVSDLRKQNYDLWGSEILLSKEDAYPIKSYLDFESPDEDKQYDPISLFIEVLAKAKKEEIVGIQILIAPAAPNWKDKWSDLVEELRAKKGVQEEKKYKTKIDFPGGVLPAFSVSGKGDSKEEMPLIKSFMRTPGETDVLKAIEDNLSRAAFSTLIRFIYVSPQELFYDSYARRGLTGAFNQYGALDLNSFRQNYAVSTRTRLWSWPHIFPKIRNQYRKQRLIINYRKREVPPETTIGRLLTSHLLNWNFSSKRYMLTTRSLATLFHPPTFMVLTAPHLRRVESRKIGPPAGLAIYGEEKEIEKYK